MFKGCYRSWQPTDWPKQRACWGWSLTAASPTPASPFHTPLFTGSSPLAPRRGPCGPHEGFYCSSLHLHPFQQHKRSRFSPTCRLCLWTPPGQLLPGWTPWLWSKVPSAPRDASHLTCCGLPQTAAPVLAGLCYGPQAGGCSPWF